MDPVPTQPLGRHLPPGSGHQALPLGEPGRGMAPPSLHHPDTVSRGPQLRAACIPLLLGKLRDVRVFGVTGGTVLPWNGSGRDQMAQQAGKGRTARTKLPTHQASWRKSPTTGWWRSLQTPAVAESRSPWPLSAWHPSFRPAPLGQAVAFPSSKDKDGCGSLGPAGQGSLTHLELKRGGGRRPGWVHTASSPRPAQPP